MRAEDISKTIAALWAIKRPIYITSAPGAGKTSIVKQSTDMVSDMIGEDVQYIHMHGPTMLVEDFGLPIGLKDDSNTFGYKMPHWWPTDPDLKAIMCFDDRGQCSADIQKVLANIILERELHGHRLPAGVMVISTGNRTEDRAGANRVLTHLANRETRIEFDVMLDDWTRWAISNDVSPSVISFLRFRPNLLHNFDPQRELNPTPRAWVDGVSDVLGLVPPDFEYDVIKGAVGEGPAAEFVGFRKIERSLPNLDNLLLHPDTATVPTDPAALYAISGGIAHRASKGNFERVITYCNRMPPEFSVLTVSYATRKSAELSLTPAFTDWAVRHQDVLF